MSNAYTRQLVDNEQNQIYPVTVAKAVYLPNGTDTVQRVLGDLKDQNTTIEFEGNTITKTLASGNVETTTFNADGSITAVTVNSDGQTIETKQTTFEDGTIHIVVS